MSDHNSFNDHDCCEELRRIEEDMKRQIPDEYLVGTKHIWPLFFWVECDHCHVEFRRESGWRYSHEDYSIVTVELCGTCAPTREVAAKMVRGILKK